MSPDSPTITPHSGHLWQSFLLLEIRVAADPLAVGFQDFMAFPGGDALPGDGRLGEVPEAALQVARVVFHVAEHIGDGVALDFVGVDRFAVFQVDADDIGVAKQVVQVAEGLLVGADEEDADVVVLVGLGGRAAGARWATSSRSMKRSILPSQSQVMSASDGAVAWAFRRAGGSA